MVVEMPLEGERAKGNGKRRAVIESRAWRTGALMALNICLSGPQGGRAEGSPKLAYKKEMYLGSLVEGGRIHRPRSAHSHSSVIYPREQGERVRMLKGIVWMKFHRATEMRRAHPPPGLR
jgi:hypothetical protein